MLNVFILTLADQLVELASAAQRLALPAWGWEVDSPSKRDSVRRSPDFSLSNSYPAISAQDRVQIRAYYNMFNTNNNLAIRQVPKTPATRQTPKSQTLKRARQPIALKTYQNTTSAISAVHRKSMQTEVGKQKPIARIVKGKLTGYQSVISDAIIAGHTIQPKR